MADGILYAQSASARKREFTPNESYMHDAAKRVVAQWFRDSQTPLGGVHVGDVYSRTNRFVGSKGVYLEYPIGTEGQGVCPCWDEAYDPPSGSLMGESLEDLDWVPTVEFLRAKGVRTKCVCDIMLLHKGSASVAIEIVHRHPTPMWKRLFLSKWDIKLVEVKAQAALHFTKAPKSLPFFVPRGDQS